MQVVKTFDNYFSANLILNRLSNDGIKCRLLDEQTVSLDPLLNIAVGGIKLAVQEEDVKASKELFDEYEKQYIEEAICIRCKSKSFEKLLKPAHRDLQTRIIQLFNKDYQLPAEVLYRCGQCHLETKTLPDEHAYYNV